VDESLGVFPTRHILDAAIEVAAILGGSPKAEAQMRESFRLNSSGGLFGVSDLQSGQRLLVQLGLVRYDGDRFYPLYPLGQLVRDGQLKELGFLILESSLATTAPAWLFGSPKELDILCPDNIKRVIDGVLSPEERESLLLAAAQRVNPLRNVEIGSKAEEFVLEQIQTQLDTCGCQELISKVSRVSLVSDYLGYDLVAPSSDGRTLRIEVKGSAGGLWSGFHLSRGQAQAAQRDPNWFLVFCDLSRPLTTLIGHLQWAEIAAHVPVDAPDSCGTWQHVHLRFSRSIYREGLPKLC
jgi:hypothetical protein